MEKYIVRVSLNLEIEASSETIAMVKARKKFGKHYIHEIVVHDQDGTVLGSIQPEMSKTSYLLSPLRLPGGR